MRYLLSFVIPYELFECMREKLYRFIEYPNTFEFDAAKPNLLLQKITHYRIKFSSFHDIIGPFNINLSAKIEVGKQK